LKKNAPIVSAKRRSYTNSQATLSKLTFGSGHLIKIHGSEIFQHGFFCKQTFYFVKKMQEWHQHPAIIFRTGAVHFSQW